jgi:hypothetical protein
MRGVVEEVAAKAPGTGLLSHYFVNSNARDKWVLLSDLFSFIHVFGIDHCI